jgi:leader peptidase (prepilin peptidase)/N-methyltransferase
MMIETLLEAQSILTHHAIWGTFIHFLFCACFGSYFNVFAWRWPQIQEAQWLDDIYAWFEEKKWPRPLAAPLTRPGLSLAKPSSFCPACNTPIPFWFNIPVLGWFFLGGKAKCCGNNISYKYPLFEMTCGLVGALAWLHFQNLWQTEIFLLFAMPLFMASQTDFESMMLPDSITGFLLFTGLGLAIFGVADIDAKQSFIGILSGYAILATIRFFGRIAFKKEAMGQGDPKFLAAIGAWVGFMPMPHILLVASVAGLLYALMLKISGKLDGAAVPFGPFLALAGMVAYIAKFNL